MGERLPILLGGSRRQIGRPFRSEACIVNKVSWIIRNVGIEICAFRESTFIFAQESTSRRIVVSGAIVIKAGFGVPFPPGVAEIVHDAAGRGNDVAKRIVSVVGGDRSCGIAESR